MEEIARGLEKPEKEEKEMEMETEKQTEEAELEMVLEELPRDQEVQEVQLLNSD